MKIIFSADWHFSQKRKYITDHVCENYFNDLSQIKEPFIQIIGGDIFDNKMNSSVDDFILVKDFLQRCEAYSDVYVILGNHDFNIRNKTSGNMIDKVLDNFKFTRIVFLKNSGVHSIGNIHLHVFSIYDDMNYQYKKVNTTNTVNIGLYHGLLKGSSFFNGHIKKTQGLDKEYFSNKGLDLLLLGDVHKRQEIQITDTLTAIYTGSPYQVHFGENINNHGYTVVNIDEQNKLSYNFEDLENQYNFVKLNYDNNQFNILNI